MSPKSFIRPEGQFEYCAFDMFKHYIWVERVYPRSFGRGPKQPAGVSCKKLVDGQTGWNDHGRRNTVPSARPSYLLPDRCNASRKAVYQSKVKRTDVYSQFEGICAHHCFELSVSQVFFSLPPFCRQVSRAIASYRTRIFPIFQKLLFQTFKKQFHICSRPGEEYRTDAE